jgi:aryl-alcohol dehydrogenase-like predicted oxidoreductase
VVWKILHEGVRFIEQGEVAITPINPVTATAAQIALAWLLAQKPWIVPIPGTTTLERVDENIGTTAIEPSPEDLREIDSATSRISVQGDRYPEELERMTYR